MGKLKRVLRLINLLTHRQQVTLETIKKACGIPERTAYRYLRDISEANFPIYFDRNSHAYRLDRQASVRVEDFDIEETLLMIVALRRLASGLNEAYQKEIEELIGKILVRQPIPLEEILDAYQHQIGGLVENQDCSRLISSMLISAAVRFERKVRLTMESGSTEGKDLSIENPALRFKKHWQLVDGTGPESGFADFPQIKKVSLLRP